jgi:hypothetical protein
LCKKTPWNIQGSGTADGGEVRSESISHLFYFLDADAEFFGRRREGIG